MITVTIAGRLGKDAELRQTNNTQVCGFSVAADTGFGDHKQSHWVCVRVESAGMEFLSLY